MIGVKYIKAWFSFSIEMALLFFKQVTENEYFEFNLVEDSF